MVSDTLVQAPIFNRQCVVIQEAGHHDEQIVIGRADVWAGTQSESNKHTSTH